MMVQEQNIRLGLKLESGAVWKGEAGKVRSGYHFRPH